MKFLIDNWGLLSVLSYLRKTFGIGGIKAFAEWDRFYLAQAAAAVLQCTDCRRPGTDFARLALTLAERKGLLSNCEVRAEQPRRRPPALVEEYFQMLEDVLLARACELATRQVRDVVPEEEARAYYHALMSSPYYSAYRAALYVGLKVPTWGRVLLIGAGTQEPLDFITACNILQTQCRFAAMEVDEEVFRDLQRLAAKYGFETYLGWDVPRDFDGAVAQSVLHWATNPLDVLSRARAAARRLLLAQGVLEGAGAGFLLTYVLGAQRAVSWKEAEALAEEAGWRLLRRYAKYPAYVAVYR